MEDLNIEQTTRTPKIRFSDGKLLLWGTFVPVDPANFVLPLLEWVRSYSNAPEKETIVDVGIHYSRGYAMNYIHILLQELILLQNDHHQVTINWHFSPDSIDFKAGEYLSRKLNHSFNFVEVDGIW